MPIVTANMRRTLGGVGWVGGMLAGADAAPTPLWVTLPSAADPAGTRRRQVCGERPCGPECGPERAT